MSAASQRRSPVLLFLLLLCPIALFAQAVSGVSGTVTDSSGAVLNGCQVEARDDATGVVTRTQTSSAGTYSFPSLLSGKYTITFSEQGSRHPCRAASTSRWAAIQE
jgi:hypothetical protein